jgi:long-chain acyl-CoA synthetase
MQTIREVRPTIFVAVPRFYEKFHEGLQLKLGSGTAFGRRLLDRALAAQTRLLQPPTCEGRRTWLRRLEAAALDACVLRRIRSALGGRIRYLITGSAPTAPWLLEFFQAAGLPILEAYGVSENTIPIAANRPEELRFGSVGRPLSGNDVRLADDGEVLVRSAGMFRGYLGAERESRFTADGFYCTGDLGRFDDDGFLYLTGRKAELIKTSTGRRISPVRVETVYRQSPLFEQFVTIGNGRRFLSALIVLNEQAVAGALRKSGGSVPHRSIRSSGDSQVAEIVQTELERLGQELPPQERVARFAILPRPLSIEAGELTPTLKLRRAVIEANHQELIDPLYSGSCETVLEVAATV